MDALGHHEDEDGGLGEEGISIDSSRGAENYGEFTDLQDTFHAIISDWRKERPVRIISAIGCLWDNVDYDSAEMPGRRIIDAFNCWADMIDEHEYEADDAKCEYAYFAALKYVMQCYTENKKNKYAINYCKNHPLYREDIIQHIFNKAVEHGRKEGPALHAEYDKRRLEKERIADEIEAKHTAEAVRLAAEELRLAEEKVAKMKVLLEAKLRFEADAAEKVLLSRAAAAARLENERKAAHSKSKNQKKKDRKNEMKAACAGGGHVDVAGGGSGGGAAGAREEMAASSSNSGSSASADDAQIALGGGVGVTTEKNLTNTKIQNLSPKSVGKAGKHDVHSSGGAAGGGRRPAGGSPGKVTNTVGETGKASETVGETIKDNGHGCAFVSSHAARG